MNEFSDGVFFGIDIFEGVENFNDDVLAAFLFRVFFVYICGVEGV